MKIQVEFEVNDRDGTKDYFNRWLQIVTGDTVDVGALMPCPVIGYRADDQVQRREALAKFVDAMEITLRRNDHKSTWKDKPVEALLRLLVLEVEEAKVAMEFFSVAEGKHELVDIACFAMILFDRLGMLDQERGIREQNIPR